MAAGSLPKPSTSKKGLGPCAPNCHRWTLRWATSKVIAEGESHKDCESLRQQAASLCSLCSQQIGFDARFYADSADGTLTHAACLEAEDGH